MNLYERAVSNMPEFRCLICEECGTRQEITRTQATRYLQQGWPKCCNYTMRLVTVNEPEPTQESTP